ncbi:hypothetical protein PybrP1_009352 [[Pythium] brassicae (nom. inval.)]|nr:hypothetical protein PybrP1_009352 [[Pythium] brassicae (nom. inval.)]
MEAVTAGRDSDVLHELHAHAASADDAKDALPPADEESGERAAASAEISGDASAAHASSPSLDADTTDDPAPADGKSGEDGGDASVAPASDYSICSVCKDPSGGDVNVCSGCGMAAHSACYAGELPRALPSRQNKSPSKRSHKKRRIRRDVADTGTAGDDETSGDGADWKCDCCVHEVAAAEELLCVFCEQPGDGSVMKCVETHTWGEPWATRNGNSKRFGHLLCSRWDPFAFEQQLLDQHDQLQREQEQIRQQVTHESANEQAVPPPPTPQQTRNHRLRQADAPLAVEPAAHAAAAVEPDPPATILTEPTPIPAYEPNVSLRLAGACCFCESTRGVRIQCQRVDCGLFFHAMCAHERSGRLEIRALPQAPSLVEYHAYCSRHRDSAMSAAALVDLMLTKPVTSLTGRDAVLRFLTVKRRLEANAFPTIHAFFNAVATVLTDLCKNGLKKSKTDPPTHSVKHLQVLRLFLDRVPQLQAVYRAPFPRRLPLGDDSEQLYALLHRTFDPPRLLGKFAGPVSQLHTCDVCTGPFSERQHLLYCLNPVTPHVQHWKCTKRRSTSREREKIAASLVAASAGGAGGVGGASAKKKLTSLALVLNGQLCDVKLPKGLPGVSDGIICALCRCDVDASGLLASRKEGKRAEFAKKRSDFVLGGCFANAGDLPTVSISSTMALPSAAAKGPDPKQPVGAAKAAVANDRNRNKRSAGELSSAKPVSALVGAVVPTPSATTAAAAVAPPATPAAALLGPPKMERIQVQRTTKWLAHVAQIIRLAGARAKLSRTTAGAEEAPAPPAPVTTPAAAAALPPVAASASSSEPAPARPVAAPTERSDAESLRVVLATPKAPSSDELARRIDAHFAEAIAVVRPFDADAYVLARLETARRYLRDRSGPAVGVLRMLAHEYTRIVSCRQPPRGAATLLYFE